MPRFKNRNVYGSLTSISLLKRLAGKTWALGGRPWRRMSRDRSPPRYDSRRTKKQYMTKAFEIKLVRPNYGL